MTKTNIIKHTILFGSDNEVVTPIEISISKKQVLKVIEELGLEKAIEIFQEYGNDAISNTINDIWNEFNG